MATNKQNTGAATPATADQVAILQQNITQNANAYRAAAASGNTAEAQRLAVQGLVLNVQYMVATGNEEGLQELAKVAPALVKFAAEKRSELAATAAGKNIELRVEQSQKQRELLDTELRKIFDLGVSGAQSTVSLLGMARGFAALLTAFGVDCKDFITKCDEGIRDAEASAGHIDYSRLDKINKNIDTSTADKQIKDGVQRAAEEIDPAIAEKTYRELLGFSLDAPAGAQSQGNKVLPKANIEVKTDDALKVIKDNAQGLSKDASQKAEKALEKSASLDGNAANLSSPELKDLNAKMINIAGPAAAAKIMDGIRNEAKLPERQPQ